ncbi:MAG: hypothetical protein ISP49_02810 [Reyranella sp.]|nr:hypothetical protein [Reyranella sp.]MBL6650494.1 hypothetical protein [Reyranella sp.]
MTTPSRLPISDIEGALVTRGGGPLCASVAVAVRLRDEFLNETLVVSLAYADVVLEIPNRDSEHRTAAQRDRQSDAIVYAPHNVSVLQQTEAPHPPDDFAHRPVATSDLPGPNSVIQ